MSPLPLRCTGPPDLSFNRIGRIEGLEALVNLTDLSLFGNRIEEVAGLDTLTKLECLSIGNNLIERADSIAYLRCLPKLRSLCLRGNPVAEDGEYTSHVIAQLPNLVFLDYALIKDEQVRGGRRRYWGSVTEPRCCAPPRVSSGERPRWRFKTWFRRTWSARRWNRRRGRRGRPSGRWRRNSRCVQDVRPVPLRMLTVRGAGPPSV